MKDVFFPVIPHQNTGTTSCALLRPSWAVLVDVLTTRDRLEWQRAPDGDFHMAAFDRLILVNSSVRSDFGLYSSTILALMIQMRCQSLKSGHRLQSYGLM